MLAANVESRKQSAHEWANDSKTEAPATVKPTEIKLEELPVARREEEEEAESDLDAEYDDEIESEFEDAGDFEDQGYSPVEPKGPREPPDVRSLTSHPPVYRKRSHDETSEEPESQPPPMNVPDREGTPPKRARLDDDRSSKTTNPLHDSPPLRQRKRSSEELEDSPHSPELQSPKRVKA